jgi:hypothetical protein
MMKLPDEKLFVGKTIKSVNCSASNVMLLTFTDGTMLEIWAEIGGWPTLPFLMVNDDPDPENFQ